MSELFVFIKKKLFFVVLLYLLSTMTYTEMICIMLQKPKHELRPKLSSIVKQELINIPQTHGTFFDGNGKYCVQQQLRGILAMT
jgi:hypothetical protein